MIVRKYANVLMQRADSDYFLNRLELLSKLYEKNLTFKDFIDSKITENNQKISLILDIFENNSVEFENFIKLLTYNTRLNQIGLIFKEMKKQKLRQENKSSAIIYTKEKIPQNILDAIEKDLSNQFEIMIQLENKIWLEGGIKISLDDLGYEINLSSNYLKEKIKNYILEAI